MNVTTTRFVSLVNARECSLRGLLHLLSPAGQLRAPGCCCKKRHQRLATSRSVAPKGLKDSAQGHRRRAPEVPVEPGDQGAPRVPREATAPEAPGLPAPVAHCWSRQLQVMPRETIWASRLKARLSSKVPRHLLPCPTLFSSPKTGAGAAAISFLTAASGACSAAEKAVVCKAWCSGRMPPVPPVVGTHRGSPRPVGSAGGAPGISKLQLGSPSSSPSMSVRSCTAATAGQFVAAAAAAAAATVGG